MIKQREFIQFPYFYHNICIYSTEDFRSSVLSPALRLSPKNQNFQSF